MSSATHRPAPVNSLVGDRQASAKPTFGLAILLSLVALPALAAGQLDPQFGIAGSQTVAFDVASDFDDSAFAAALQSSGRLILGGSVRTENDRFSVGLTRLFADGRVDTGFGQSGRLVIRDSEGQFLIPLAAAVQPDDKILLTGARFPTAPGGQVDAPFGTPGTIEWFAIRVHADGSGLDPSFGVAGMTLMSFGFALAYGNAIALQDDGRIVVAGVLDGLMQTSRMAAVRLTSSGIVDTSFGGGDGVYSELFAVDYGNAEGNAVVIQPDGGIVIGGSARKTNGDQDKDMALLRLDSLGVPDPSFGNLAEDGRSIIDYSGPGDVRQDTVHTLAYRAELVGPEFRRIVIGGASAPAVAPKLPAIAMLDYSGSLDNGFDSDGKATLAASFNANETAIYAIALERLDSNPATSSDHIVVGGTRALATANACFAVRMDYSGAVDSRFNGGNVLDIRIGGANSRDNCRAAAYANERLFLVGANAPPLPSTSDFAVSALLVGGYLLQDGFE